MFLFVFTWLLEGSSLPVGLPLGLGAFLRDRRAPAPPPSTAGGALSAEAAPWLGHDLMDSHRSCVLCGPQGPPDPQRPHGPLHGALCRCGRLQPEHGLRSAAPWQLTHVPSLLPPAQHPATPLRLHPAPPVPRALRPSGHLHEQAALGLKVSTSPVCTTHELGGDSVLGLGSERP